MTTYKIHLAEVPTDVLVYLAQHDSRLHTVADLATALAPADADHAVGSVSRALALLREAGYVYRNGGYCWGVTTAGMTAVAEAQAKQQGASTEAAGKGTSAHPEGTNDA